MDRGELLEIWANQRALEYIGAGCYNTVRRLSPSMVVKFSNGKDDADESTWDYMEWCHLRLLTFGARSPEMVGFPIVLGLLNEQGMRMAVMMRCEDSHTKHEHLGTSAKIAMFAGTALRTLCDVFGVPEVTEYGEEGWKTYLDLHSGNIMWCSVRGCLVLNDPFYDGVRRSNGTQPAYKAKVKKQAQWLRPGLKNLYQGARC